MKRRVAIAALACLWAPGAFAQQGTQTTPVFTKNFQPTSSSAEQLSVGPSSSRIALPGNDTIVIYNTGANAAFVAFGDQTVVATPTNDVIQPGSWMAFSRTIFTPYMAAIETAGATTLNISGGIGSPQGAGGGSGGGSSGGGGSNASVGGVGTTAPGSATYIGMLISSGNMVGASGSTWGTAPTGQNVLGANVSVLSTVLPAGAAVSAKDNTAFVRGTSNMVPTGCQYNTAETTITNGNQGMAECNSFGQLFIDVNNNSNFASILSATTDSANNNKTATAVNVTPGNCSGAISTGGQAQNIIGLGTATIHGFTIMNVDTGHNDELLWVSFTTTAAPLTQASFPLVPPAATTFLGAGSYTTPPGFGSNHAVSIIGATTGHIWSCYSW